MPAEASWPSLLEKMTGVHTFNYGVSGDTTFDGLRRLDNVLQTTADIVLLEFGINDFFMGIPVSSALSNLEVMVRAFLDKGAKVVMVGFSFQGLGTQKWEEAYERLSNRLNVLFYENIFRGLERCNDCFLPDGLHPNEKGYITIAENINNFLHKYRLI